MNKPQQFIENIVQLRGEKDIELLRTAIELYHNKPSSLLEKGLGIANILLSLGLDNEILAAALLYPAFKAHEIHLDIVTEKLSDVSSKLLHNVLQMQSIEKLQFFEQRSSHQIENTRKMLLAMASDVRAVIIILAERLWKLREAEHASKGEQQKLAQETFDIFAPLANRLGIWQLKWELEDLCLRYLQPEVYTEITKGLELRLKERERYIQRIITIMSKMVQETSIKNFQITGRIKHIYSIYKKMLRKSVSLDKIYDIVALRVLVPEIADCYSILGLLQNVWQQIPEEFDDYIAHSKPNGYRSIHAVLIGPDNGIIEVQIRTYQMHRESELGVAAHWRYKESVLQTLYYEEKIALLRQIMAWQEEIASNGEPKTKQALHDVFSDQIYVFTPMGDIIDLPKGATPLDFAYHIHSDIGHRCRGAKIGGNIVPLTYQLKTGECVEILTAKQAKPSRDWLNPHHGYLKTARARAKVQHWFKVNESTQNITTGQKLLEKELKRLRMHEKINLNSIAEKLNYHTDMDLLAALGAGNIGVTHIINQIRKTVPTSTEPILAVRQQEHKFSSSIQILGVNNLLTQIARCCKPLPGDSVIGYVTRNKGVSIHRRNCGNLLHTTKNNKKKLIEVSWGEKHSDRHAVDLLIRTIDRTGLLRDITAVLASEKINIIGLHTHKSPHSPEADIYLTIDVAEVQKLKKTLELLKHTHGVIKAIIR